ncbi:hypothetical protein [Pedobacter sp. UBA5917]|jgi:hypothetical protein|uniref:hypothetical protein n=1 Tax=Pedobacter sp. UBA5917 TaxID=1947061 RepID=UPI0025EF8827|nr:hypothetical protein [Pedobacter sp. UBA5917]
MSDLKTISKNSPQQESMQFDKLREMGINRIQALSQQNWTDYNLHDPGITTLEALCYAITDLGYRLTFDMQDLLANNPNITQVDFHNFFTARQILHNAPVTIKDFRKLLMDVAVTVDQEILGIKNAWVIPADDAEMKLYVNQAQQKLDYFPTATDGTGFFVKGLYNFLIEFDQSIVYGDLNSNAMEGTYVINNFGGDPWLNGVEIKVSVHFPRWDDLSIDFSSDTKIINNIKSLKIEVDELPTGYKLFDNNDFDHTVTLAGTKMVAGVPTAITGLSAIDSELNHFIFDAANGLLQSYKRKIAIIKSIIKKAEDRLNDNRPLCENYFNTRALKVEEIAICGDIEIDPFADAATVAAEIYFRLAQFLSPDVYFYSLPDMKSRGKSTEDIFDGPALAHGFIDDDELNASEQKCTIHVSDLIRIIMDVKIDGKRVVQSVSGLQLANFPEDNSSNDIAQKSVKWCLSLAIDKFCVPRLSTDLSNLSFFKHKLPFAFDQDEMEAKYRALFATARKRYPENPILDRALPIGNWREITDYTSIQEDFPLIYGVGSEGIPNLPAIDDERNLRLAQAKQFKGFLSFFDQLLYNYLQQVNGLKALFSLNQELDEFGQPLMNKTYFSESLKATAAHADIVPNATGQKIFANDYATKLQGITESKSAYEKRKNRFLDHLLARFCEQFSDYALIAYTNDGQKAGAELIKDKLSFLNAYPEISSNRGKAFNYKNELSWFYQNVSGYEKRVGMLLGIDAKKTADLHFSKAFRILPVSNKWSIDTKVSTKNLFEGIISFNDQLLAKAAMEELISAGVHINNYKVIAGTTAGKFQVLLYADLIVEKIIAKSKNTALTKADSNTLINNHISLCIKELCGNILSNRKNLAAPISNYFEVLAHTVNGATTPPLHTVKYQLFDLPAEDVARKVIITGEIEGPEVKGADAAGTTGNTIASLLWKFIRFASDEDYYRFVPENTTVNEPNYHFEIFDIYGTVLGKHKGRNYNHQLSDIMEDSTALPLVKIVDSLSNNGTYTVKNTVALGPDIKIEINETLPNNYPDGKLSFSETFNAYIFENGRELTITGTDLTNRLRTGDKMNFITPSAEITEFEILNISFANNKTTIVSDILLDFVVAPKLDYTKLFEIKNITHRTVIIRAGMEKLARLDMVNFFNRTFIDREGLHLIEHVLLRPKKRDFDTLLDIHTDVDCVQCKIADTYSFVMTAVLPYWPNRFRERNFRTFIEKTLREECPAHVVLNVCWVNPLQMNQFETAYKNWLIQINTSSAGDAERVKALKNFIESIQGLRSVYPSGKLHSCNENEVQKNPLILNQTNIGIF